MLRDELKELYQERREMLKYKTSDADPLGSRMRINEHIGVLKYQLAPIEERLSLALTPVEVQGSLGWRSVIWTPNLWRRCSVLSATIEGPGL